ncbi:MAG TPA: Hpt domain-containing protein, partial [Polyangiaceae bacterium]|nr:Hpt domain-containing protein [Polyangiaceae bacterium]
PGLASPALDPNVRRSATVIALFRKHSPEQLLALKKAADADELRKAAHKLKGTCLVFGMPRASELCVAIEENPGHAEVLLSSLTLELDRAHSELDAEGSRVLGS